MAESFDLMELKELFEKATKYVKSIVSTLNTEDLLEFYGFYKQATEGPCNTSKPSWYDFEGKHKWNAWNKLEKMSENNAMVAYCNKLTNIDSEWEAKADNLDSDSGPKFSWVATSRLKNLDVELEESEKNIFEWVKEGNMNKVQGLSSSANINELDTSGLALLHWATDRGNLNMVEYLVSILKADINIQDREGQTPLHYAVSCDYVDIVEYLVKSGARTDIQDNEQIKPIDLSENLKIKEVLLKCCQHS